MNKPLDHSTDTASLAVQDAPTGQAGHPGTVMRAQMARINPWLRFPDELETGFRAWQARASRRSRIVLGVAVIIILVVNTAFEFAALRPNAGFRPAAHWLQWGLEIPLAALAVLCHLRDSWQRYWDASLIAAGLLIAFGVQAQRVFDLTWGFEMPALFAPIIVALGAIASRLRFWAAVPTTAIFFLGWAASELLRYGGDNVTVVHNIFVGFILMLGILLSLHGLELQARYAWLQREWNGMMAETDPMTMLPNRRALGRFVDQLMSFVQREQRGVAVAVVDIDHFKSFNDRYGHTAGDDCIRQVGEALVGQARRPLDMAARLGGEEFVVIWYGRDPDTLTAAAEGCRNAIRDLDITHADGIEGRVTVSVGAVSLPPDQMPDFDHLYRAADAALYAAKQAGRDRVSVSHLGSGGTDTAPP